MTAPEPTAVERTIAEVDEAHEARNIYVERIDCRCGETIHGGDFRSIYAAHRAHRVQAVVAAIRNLPPEQMAQLIGGKVEQAIRYSNSRFYQRAVTPWREVTGPATPARDLTPGARHDL